MRTCSALLALLLALAGGAASARPARAQELDSLAVRGGVTREVLEVLLARLEATMRAADSSDEARAAAGAEAAAVRARLAEGDFQPGDRVLLMVEGGGGDMPLERTAPGAARSVEQQLSDTFTVGAGRQLTLPVIGTISLRGVLRSELEHHLSREIGKYIRDPVVRARALIRVSVLGAVARPGFYAVPADALLSDALMAAGGPTGEAKLRELRIERAGKELWTGERLQLAMTHGKTLDDLSLRAGDEFVLPGKGKSSTYETVRTLGILLTVPITVYTLTQIFKK